MIINAGTVKSESPYVAKIGSIWQEPGKITSFELGNELNTMLN